MSWDTYSSIRLLKAASSLILSVSRDRASAISLGNLFQKFHISETDLLHLQSSPELLFLLNGEGTHKIAGLRYLTFRHMNSLKLFTPLVGDKALIISGQTESNSLESVRYVENLYILSSHIAKMCLAYSERRHLGIQVEALGCFRQRRHTSVRGKRACGEILLCCCSRFPCLST